MFDVLAVLFDKFVKLTTDANRPSTVVIDGDTYGLNADRTLGAYVRKPLPQAPPTAPVLPLRTLSGFVAAFGANIDEFPGEVAVQVESHDSVALVSMRQDQYGQRHVWMRAKAPEENAFRFGNHYQIEEFLIALQAGFLPSENVTAISRLCSCVTAGNSVQAADDGISMRVTIKEGEIERGNIDVPNRLPLAPYRTFREIEPVASDFLLRMKAVKDSLPTVALLEVDGGKWKLDTILAIGAWLQQNLPANTTVIA